jgi:hypothetical protein
MHITGQAPVDYEVVAYQPLTISVSVTFNEPGDDAVTVVYAGALVGQLSRGGEVPASILGHARDRMRGANGRDPRGAAAAEPHHERMVGNGQRLLRSATGRLAGSSGPHYSSARRAKGYGATPARSGR